MAAARASSHSQAGATGSPALSISHVPSPWPVTAMAISAFCQVGHFLGQQLQRLRRVGPGARHVLFGAAVGKRLIEIGDRRRRNLLARRA